jgi:hypothetical protein
MKAWHFLNNGMYLGYNDGREIKVGRTLKVEPPIHLCHKGLHASERIIDALKYAQKPLVSRVVLSGEIKAGEDKHVATARRVLWVLDCEKILHEFACRCAVRALKVAKVTDKRCWDAIKAKRDWLDGKITVDELNEKRAATDADAYAAYAAYAAAAAATDADAYAAYAAAAAATDAARKSERDWQNRMLTRMILKAHYARLAP